MKTAFLLTALGTAGWLYAVLPAAAESLPVERFTVEEGAGAVNSFLVDVGTGLVVIDAQRTLSAGRELAATADAREKAVEAIFLTHPHPDHVGGLEALEEATQAPIHGSSDTSVELAADTRKLLRLSHEAMPDDTVAMPPAPTVIVADGDRLSMGEVEFEVMEMGPSEAVTMTLYAVPRASVLFAGDLLSPGMTPFLLEKRTADWLEQLDVLEQRFEPSTLVYPGHGVPGPLGEMVTQQRDYLVAFRQLVAEALDDGKVDEDERAHIVERTEAAYPDHPPVAALPDLLSRNITAVAEELSGEPGAPPVATIEE